MISSKPKLAIIGAGNMGSSLIGGLIAKHYPAQQIWASNPSLEKLEQLQKKFAISVSSSNIEAAEQAEVIIFSVKPKILASVIQELAPQIQANNPLIISIVTGVREARLQTWLGGKTAIVRAMPNTPALIGCGATALYANASTSRDQTQLAEYIFRSVGITLWLEEEALIDTVTALSGSGPAYFFLLMEALEDAGRALGLSEEVSHLLTLHTAYGAAQLALKSKEELSNLRRQITSPGGTTEAALRTFEEGGFQNLVLQALKAAKKRAEELAEPS